MEKIEESIVEKLDEQIVQRDVTTKRELEALQSISFPVEPFTWKGRASLAYVLQLVDGDTISVALYDRNHTIFNIASNGLVQMHVRLYGIDTPEKKPLLKDPNRLQIKQMAAESSKHLHQLLCLESIWFDDRIVTLLFQEHDKYGRPLAIVYKGNAGTQREAWQKSVNHKMISCGLAVPYSGDSKCSFAVAQAHYLSKRNTQHTSLPDSWDIDNNSLSHASVKVIERNVQQKSLLRRMLQRCFGK